MSLSIELIAGVDEVGRGPLAGPVVAAAVILNPAQPIDGLTDSKKLSEKKREALFPMIQERAVCWAIAECSVEEIDRLNILQASLEAMRRAVAQLTQTPNKVLVDGNKIPQGLPCAAEAIVGGDLSESCISAASILAKVYRDRLMVAMDAEFPGYGLAKHKGYPTKQHREALIELGPMPHHRKSFAPVQRLLDF